MQVTKFPVAPGLPRRTFTMTAQHIRRQKQRIDDLTGSSATTPSTFVTVAALAWVSFVRSKHPIVISIDHDVYLSFFVDCRGRRCGGIDPPISEDYFGTCLSGCLARATARDLLAEDNGVAAAAAAIQKEVRRAGEDPLALWDWMAYVRTLPRDRAMNVSGSTRFQAYETTDFGWGQSSRTELVTMNRSGQVVLVAAKGGGGGVQTSVCMHPDHMDGFSSHFVKFLD